jgi:hypothetical protein
MGTSPGTNELPVTPTGTHSVQDTTAARSLLEIGRSLPSFVQKATAVLSDELKGFASRGTEPFGNPFPSEPSNLERTVEQFREQVRELVDTFVNMLQYRPEEMGRFASKVAGVASSYADADTKSVPLLKPPPPVKAGETGYILLSVENDDPNEAASCMLYTTDLVGPLAHSISKTHISISPSTIRIPPGGSNEVRIDIRVPLGTPPGKYGGLVHAVDIGLQQFVLQIAVVP